MELTFFKYQGAGNDFVIIDDRESTFDATNQPLIEQMCDRRFGIGADGLMLIRKSATSDFTMIYFNADGNESSMCGNGGRCIAHLAVALGIATETCSFEAIDGLHQARVMGNTVELHMMDVDSIEEGPTHHYMDTGSPHYVVNQTSLSQMDIISEAKKIRYNDRFREVGTNVNFMEFTGDRLHVRTYERGVEDETLACGTGVTACAISYAITSGMKNDTVVPIQAAGGELEVRFSLQNKQATNVWLIGPAHESFTGVYKIKMG